MRRGMAAGLRCWSGWDRRTHSATARTGLTCRHHRPRRGPFQHSGGHHMIQLTRRDLLAGTAATTAALVDGADAVGTARRHAPGRQAGARLLPLQDRRLRGDADRRRRAHLPDAGYVRGQPEERGRAGRGRGRLHAEGPGHDPVQPDGDQHRLEAGGDRHRQRPRRFRAEQGRGRADERQHDGGGHRSEERSISWWSRTSTATT